MRPFQAGNGAGAKDVLEMLLQYRGMVFSIGGDDDLEHRVTIPSKILLSFLLKTNARY